ncbi:MAG TPA: MFS transporter, partial [Gammaproteobacteria bacterium]|nr:MFS transporter [Gammaproteobacteria bacterium]
SLMFAILPPVARNLGLSEVQVGVIFAVSGVLWVLSSPFWGRLSDVWGRRPVILVGLLGFASSMAMFGLVVQASLAGWLALLPTYLLMIATRAVFGILGSATAPAANAYVADRTEPEERVAQLATQSAGFGLGFTIGPGVVSVLLIFGLVTPFYAIAVLGFLGALIIGLKLPEQPPRQRRASSGERMSPFDPRVLPYLLVGIALGIGQATAMQTAGFYAIDVLGMSIEQSARLVGIALMGAAAAGLFVQLVVIRLLKPLPRTMMGVGSVFAMAGFALLVFGSSYPIMLIAMVVLGFSFGLVRPGATAGASLAVSREEQGAVAGLMNTTGALGAVFAPVVGMSLYQIMPRAPYVLDFLLMIVAIALVAWHPGIRHPRR